MRSLQGAIRPDFGARSMCFTLTCQSLLRDEQISPYNGSFGLPTYDF